MPGYAVRAHASEVRYLLHCILFIFSVAAIVVPVRLFFLLPCVAYNFIVGAGYTTPSSSRPPHVIISALVAMSFSSESLEQQYVINRRCEW
ncbi:hypothetical protein PF008_g30575 [Phytophthora fragariae]|nr:hypothetical protein PF008_g30575 [Phytophthora fragariae]